MSCLLLMTFASHCVLFIHFSDSPVFWEVGALRYVFPSVMGPGKTETTYEVKGLQRFKNFIKGQLLILLFIYAILEHSTPQY